MKAESPESKFQQCPPGSGDRYRRTKETQVALGESVGQRRDDPQIFGQRRSPIPSRYGSLRLRRTHPANEGEAG